MQNRWTILFLGTLGNSPSNSANERLNRQRNGLPRNTWFAW
jgi:hypothetical protein